MTENREQKMRCIIAGGGTGGHLFPGIAIAGELEARNRDTALLFVVGRRRMESEILRRYGYQVAFIDVEGMKGRGWKKGLSVLSMLPKSLVQSMRIIKDFKPSFVMGVGGYSSGPFCLAARLMGISTAIHEQNSYPGLTNRLLARVVDRIFVSFEESASYFKPRNSILTGNPVRHELFSPSQDSSPPKDNFTVLVVGGSQGARAINEAFVKAYGVLKKSGKNITFIHQTGEHDHKRVVAAYGALGIEDRGLETLKLEANVIPFIKDMASAYHRADMVVSRAGATTIFELAALSKPSILIPYPYATNGHQETNARSLANRGGGEVLLQKDLTAEGLAKRLLTYMNHPQHLKKMGDAALSFSRPDADRIIVDEILKLTGRAGK
ncbi:MAG: undecaprenyldiphospho-muramoylpentapeptide beta-N-acetylglucosaminyltransferase [Desulfobacteraceae bacterium 4572_87]|nr:MAG: undecaprenyldiphospho-muramoylpentapeptide beta-N-acetylglucosaminyltransferase [Desulfobacteraceae bacterium 4572_87]